MIGPWADILHFNRCAAPPCASLRATPSGIVVLSQILTMSAGSAQASAPSSGWSKDSGDQQDMNEVSDTELLGVIKDFLEMGHVDNIVAMFFRESRYFEWTGAILDDQRFAVRLGVSVLFEELQARQCPSMHLAIPSLAALLSAEDPLLRGEALSVLAIINDQSLRDQALQMLNDQNSQVREIAKDIVASFNISG